MKFYKNIINYIFLNLDDILDKYHMNNKKTIQLSNDECVDVFSDFLKNCNTSVSKEQFYNGLTMITYLLGADRDREYIVHVVAEGG